MTESEERDYYRRLYERERYEPEELDPRTIEYWERIELENDMRGER